METVEVKGRFRINGDATFIKHRHANKLNGKNLYQGVRIVVPKLVRHALLDDRTRCKTLDYEIISDNIYSVCYASKGRPIEQQAFIKVTPIFIYELSFTEEEKASLLDFDIPVEFNTPEIPSYFGNDSFFKKRIVDECINTNLIRFLGKGGVCRKITAINTVRVPKGNGRYYYNIKIKERPLSIDKDI